MRSLVGGSCAFGAQPWKQLGRGDGGRQTLGVGDRTAPGGKGSQGPLYLRRAVFPAKWDRPSPALGAASRHTRADVPAAARGAGPHLQGQDQGLKSARRAAQTCFAGRHRGALGRS